MSIGSGIRNALISLGRDNNPAYVVVAIATAKGIFRPLFTMMDKKEAPETKKYAALREGLTEGIAIPTYLICGALAGKASTLIKDAKKAEMAKHNLRFAGVCVAALFIIPGLCSLIINPFTDMIFKNRKKDDPAKLNITSKSGDENVIPTAGTVAQTGTITGVKPYTPYPKISLASYTNSGLKVG